LGVEDFAVDDPTVLELDNVAAGPSSQARQEGKQSKSDPIRAFGSTNRSLMKHDSGGLAKFVGIEPFGRSFDREILSDKF
jgi:hypothetical protein